MGQLRPLADSACGARNSCLPSVVSAHSPITRSPSFAPSVPYVSDNFTWRRLGSIPIARSILRQCQTTFGNQGRPKLLTVWEVFGNQHRSSATVVACRCHRLPQQSHAATRAAAGQKSACDSHSVTSGRGQFPRTFAVDAEQPLAAVRCRQSNAPAVLAAVSSPGGHLERCSDSTSAATDGSPGMSSASPSA